MNRGDLLAVNVHLEVGHEGGGAALNDNLVQRVVGGPVLRLEPGPVLQHPLLGVLAGDLGAALLPPAGADVAAVEPHAEVDLGLARHDLLDDVLVVLVVVDRQEAQGAQVEGENGGHDSREERADVQHGAVAPEDDDKVNGLLA